MKKSLSYYLNLFYPITILEISKSKGGGFEAYIETLGRLTCTAWGESVIEAYKEVKNYKEELIKRWYYEGTYIPEPNTEPNYNDQKHRIRIKFKYLPKGVVKIISVNALSFSKLPEEYLEGYPHVYVNHSYNGNCLHIKPKPKIEFFLYKNCYLSKQVFAEMIDICKEAGDRLKIINDTSTKEVII